MCAVSTRAEGCIYCCNPSTTLANEWNRRLVSYHSKMTSEETHRKDGEGDDLQPLSVYEWELPRWVQVPAGIVLGSITLVCGLAVISLLLMRYEHAPAPLLLIAVGLLLLPGCYWIFEKCLRLITGRKKRGGLLSPNALRVVALFMLILPIAALFTGYYRERRPLAIFQAAMYLLGFLGLRVLLENARPMKDHPIESKT
jgi:hypothetical protein